MSDIIDDLASEAALYEAMNQTEYNQQQIEEEQIYAQIYDLMRKLNYPETDFNSFCGHVNQLKLERLLEVRNERISKTG